MKPRFINRGAIDFSNIKGFRRSHVLGLSFAM